MSVNDVERLVKWYLRFNGYFTVPNFTVHPDTKKGRAAEADILAVRFPYSREKPGDYCFERDSDLVLQDVVDFLIVEVKSGPCDLNEPWIEPDRRNMSYALRWMEFVPDSTDVRVLADSIYHCGTATYGEHVVRLASVGRETNDDLQKRFPHMVQVELLAAAHFLCERVTTGCARLNRQCWDAYVQEFARRAEAGQDAETLLVWTLEGGSS